LRLSVLLGRLVLSDQLPLSVLLGLPGLASL
jgi:hypothetical protein